MDPGTKYYVIIDSPGQGIQTPTFTIMTPSKSNEFTQYRKFFWFVLYLVKAKTEKFIAEPPSDIRVGSNINDELVVDFKPALASDPITVSLQLFIFQR